MLQFVTSLYILGLLILLVLIGRDHFRQRRLARLGVDPSTTKFICAYCGYDLQATRDRCPECGRPILLYPDRELDLQAMRDNPPADAVNPRSPISGEELITIHVARSELEANLLYRQMEFRGISCTYERPEFRSDCYCVRVYTGDREDALALLERFRKQEPPVPDPRQVPEIASKTISL
jgi:hypothetical protein